MLCKALLAAPCPNACLLAGAKRPRPWGSRDSSGGGREHLTLSEAGWGIRARPPSPPSPVTRFHAHPGCTQARRLAGMSPCPSRGMPLGWGGSHPHPSNSSTLQPAAW